MKAHKVTLLIVDFEQVGKKGIKEEIENANYGNDCIMPQVMEIETVDIGEWEDSHPLNQFDTRQATYEQLFKKQ